MLGIWSVKKVKNRSAAFSPLLSDDGGQGEVAVASG
jgi:hypothetical protein